MSLRKNMFFSIQNSTLEQCPYILITKPGTDLYHTCQYFMKRRFELRGKGGCYIKISRALLTCQRTEGPLQGSVCNGQIDICQTHQEQLHFLFLKRDHAESIYIYYI